MRSDFGIFFFAVCASFFFVLGIAVTRSFGDVDMAVNGCISEPEIKTIALSKRDRAIVIATDGLWDAREFR